MSVRQVVQAAVLDSYRIFGLGLNVARDRVQWRTWEQATAYFWVPFPATSVMALRQFPLCRPPDITGMLHVFNNILLKAFISPKPQGAAVQCALQRINNKIMEQQKKSCHNFGESRNGNWIKLFSPWNWEFAFISCLRKEGITSICQQVYFSLFLCSFISSQIMKLTW